MDLKPIHKPMSVARQEFIVSLTNLINECMLPPFVIEDVLKDTQNKINIIAKQQLEIDTKQYMAALSESKKSADA